jgi:hypothetical protein
MSEVRVREQGDIVIARPSTQIVFDPLAPCPDVQVPLAEHIPESSVIDLFEKRDGIHNWARPVLLRPEQNTSLPGHPPIRPCLFAELLAGLGQVEKLPRVEELVEKAAELG